MRELNLIEVESVSGGLGHILHVDGDNWAGIYGNEEYVEDIGHSNPFPSGGGTASGPVAPEERDDSHIYIDEIDDIEEFLEEETGVDWHCDSNGYGDVQCLAPLPDLPE